MARAVSVIGAYAGLSTESSEDDYEQQEQQEKQKETNNKLDTLKSNDYISSGKVQLSKDLETSKKIINSLDDSVKQELINSFDCEADYQLQKDLAAYFGSQTGINNGNLNGTININGKTIQVTRKATETAVNFYNETSGMNKGAIDIFTFTDPSTGAEIKIADANGNGVIETEELFFNELLTDINMEIMKTDTSEQEIEEPDLSEFINSDNKEKISSNQEYITEKEIEEIKQERITELYYEIIKNNPSINIYDARIQAEDIAEREISQNYSQQQNGSYIKISNPSSLTY